MKPKEKGDLAVAHAIFYFQTNGYEVCLPIGDKKPYDLVVELAGRLFKVQVKYAGRHSGENRHRAALRVMGGNQSYYTAKKYTDDAFDLLFIFSADNRRFIVPWNETNNRNSITVDSVKYERYEVK